jgi:saccharopine dehydrogenase-like NADP-dependent oxidoreductase
MHNVLLLGAGKIGAAAAKLLASTREFDVLVGDVDPAALKRLASQANVRTVQLDVSDVASVRKALEGRHSVLSACSFNVNPGIAQAALDTGASYFDLTEDVETTRAVKSLSQRAKPGQIFMPQCGLAPGFVSIAAHHLAQEFDSPGVR